MICAQKSMLDAAARMHGEAYRAAVLAAAIVDGDEICIGEEELARIRKAHGIARPKPGLGDRLAALLAKLGIKPWPGCGCAGRKKWLNELGRRLGL